MIFQPTSYQIIEIEGVEYSFAEHPSAPGIPYGQEGRQAVVYQLVSDDGSKHALKVFKQRFRVPRLTTVAEKLKPYAVLPGLQASERIVLTSSQHRSLLKKYPDLTYAVLMPWVEGPTWVEVLLSDVSLTREQSLQIVNSFIETLVAMEERGLAHCDLSGPNTIITAGNQVALVDLEEMYGPDFLKPRVVPAGSPGYAHRSAPEGLWREESDRFAGAVLLGEMLGWVSETVRANARGESYFDAGELQKGNGRFDVLARALGETWGEGVTKLLERVWQSERLVDCPTFAEWSLVLPERKEDEGISPILDSIEVGRVGFMEEDITSGLGDVWYCSYCEQPVAVKLGVCPHCELGSRPEHLVPSAEKETWRCLHCQKALTGEVEVCPYCKKGIDEPVVVLITKKKKKIPLWGWVVIGIVIVGLGLTGVAIGGEKEGVFTSQESEVPTSTNALAPTSISFHDVMDTLVSTSTSIHDLGVGATKISTMDGIVLVYVPEGVFEMGADEAKSLELCNKNYSNCKSSWFENEEPVHTVYLNAYWIYQTEVTVEMYKHCVNSGVCRLNTPKSYDVPGDYYSNSFYEKYPAIDVTWNNAVAYCQWAGGRLPTEAEWEKAARGEIGDLFPWGSNWILKDRVNFCDANCLIDWKDSSINDGYRYVAPVASFPLGISPYGVYDMVGNVWEWTADWYGSSYYMDSQSDNPQGPSDGSEWVVRGGAWDSSPKSARATRRFSRPPGFFSGSQGFRCVIDNP